MNIKSGPRSAAVIPSDYRLRLGIGLVALSSGFLILTGTSLMIDGHRLDGAEVPFSVYELPML